MGRPAVHQHARSARPKGDHSAVAEDATVLPGGADLPEELAVGRLKAVGVSVVATEVDPSGGEVGAMRTGPSAVKHHSSLPVAMSRHRTESSALEPR